MVNLGVVRQANAGLGVTEELVGVTQQCLRPVVLKIIVVNIHHADFLQFVILYGNGEISNCFMSQKNKDIEILFIKSPLIKNNGTLNFFLNLLLIRKPKLSENPFFYRSDIYKFYKNLNIDDQTLLFTNLFKKILFINIKLNFFFIIQKIKIIKTSPLAFSFVSSMII